MTRRAADFDLRAAIRSVSFTPGARDFAPLVELLGGDEDVASDAEKALLRAGPVAARFAIERADGAKGELRSRLCRFVAGELWSDP